MKDERLVNTIILKDVADNKLNCYRMFISDSEKYAFLACNNTAYTGSFLYSLDIEKEKFTVMQKILANNFLEVRFQYDEYLFALTDSKLLFFIQTTSKRGNYEIFFQKLGF